jgi:hypothetical protein
MSIGARIGNLAVRTKIFASFVVILALLAGLGGTALQRSSAMHTTVEAITTNYMISLIYLGKMRTDFTGYRGSVARQLLWADDKTARQGAEAKLAPLKKTYQEYETKYTAIVDPGTETRLDAEVKAAESAYFDNAAHLQDQISHSGSQRRSRSTHPRSLPEFQETSRKGICPRFVMRSMAIAA